MSPESGPSGSQGVLPSGFRSPVWWVRALWLLGGLALGILVLLLLAWPLGLNGGYGSAQSWSAVWLSTHGANLEGWRHATARDLGLFIPAYGLVGAGLAVTATRRWQSVTLLVALAMAADVVETVRFRQTLDSLIARQDPTRLVDETATTALFSGAKLAFLLAAAVTLAVAVLRPLERQGSDSDDVVVGSGGGDG